MGVIGNYWYAVGTSLSHDPATTPLTGSSDGHSGSMTSITAPSRAWTPTAGVAAAGLALLYLVTLTPEVCPAIYPAPPSCAPDARESTALTWGVIVIIVAALSIAATYLFPPRLRHVASRSSRSRVTVSRSLETSIRKPFRVSTIRR